MLNKPFLRIIFFIAFLIAMIFFMLPLTVSGEAYEAGSTLEVPAPMAIGSVVYLSGGVGDDEAESIRKIAKDYLLQVVFVQKLNQQEEFLAGVKVQIKDNFSNVVLDIATEGPYLLANLPQGKYLVVAEHGGVVKQQWVNVKSKTHKKLVFWWPIMNL